jgi:hypothetical protein
MVDPHAPFGMEGVKKIPAVAKMGFVEPGMNRQSSHPNDEKFQKFEYV